ncbi:hypothetical protein SDC9_152803 [bioreactor metagenome]|uniref:ribonucleoside-diphosphate reductase n=1 Tax=bioreactor metagenome TaxID=1076179 RepID=A0A645EWE7_9ZZZZ
MTYSYETFGTCSTQILFDLNGNVVTNIQFINGCDGNLKIIPKLLDGFTVDQIEKTCLGNDCEGRGTSCADQLARAVRMAYHNLSKES